MYIGQDMEIKEYQQRFKYLYAILAILFVLMISRLWYLQIINGEKYKRYSEENRIRKVTIPAPRGMIFDANHDLLIDNQPVFDLEIIPQYFFSKNANHKKSLKILSGIIGTTPSELLNTIKKMRRGIPSFQPIKIKLNLSRDEVAMIEMNKLDMPGVEVGVEILRTYTHKSIGAQLFGYIGEVSPGMLKKLNKDVDPPYRMGDFVGKFGLEEIWEKTLRGINGVEYIEVDAFGRRKKFSDDTFFANLEKKHAIPGNNLVLTIDKDLQLAAKTKFEERKEISPLVSLLALDPNNGRVLAWLSEPSYNPTGFSRGIDPSLWRNLINNPNRPLRNKVIQDHYSPGSTFKTLTAIAGLSENIIDTNSTYHCPGHWKLGNRTYHCWRKYGHGKVDVHRAIVESCDVFFYKLAAKMDIDILAKYAFMFGFGKKTGINLRREIPGLIPTKEWKKRRFGNEWIAGETLSCDIGQSFVLATTLQLANFYSAIANNGTLYKPYIVDSIETPEGEVIRKNKPEIIRKVDVSSDILNTIKKALFGVVNERKGTAWWSGRSTKFKIAGKTGTVQIVRLPPDKVYSKCEELDFKIRHHALFVGFAPYDNPKIVVAVIAPHGCHGSSGAAPLVRHVIETYLEKHKVEPEKKSDATDKKQT